MYTNNGIRESFEGKDFDALDIVFPSFELVGIQATGGKPPHLMMPINKMSFEL